GGRVHIARETGGCKDGAVSLACGLASYDWQRGGVVGGPGVALTPIHRLFCKSIWQLFAGAYADYQSARPPRSPRSRGQGKGARAAREPAEARGLHPRLHDDAQEAELRVA